MMISATTVHALDDIGQRETELRAAFQPGAAATHSEIAAAASIDRDVSPLSVASGGNAYFVVRDLNGRELFTRDGVFHIDNGTLVDRNGMPVLGYHRGDTLSPLTLDPIDDALGRIRNLRIEADGSVAYDKATIDPVTRQTERARVVVGKIALARFSAATRLEPIDQTRWRAPHGIPPHLGVAADENFPALVTHAHRRSGIDPLAGIDRLQESYLAFDALRAAHNAQGKAEKIAMDLLK
ncbi:MAG: flagellar hook basal-body protein [Candidatus Eremiobacteraeota bacterium]|nr:flagellar hook basal-body protein [Candidatus Eremiobacteraeota bacterium]